MAVGHYLVPASDSWPNRSHPGAEDNADGSTLVKVTNRQSTAPVKLVFFDFEMVTLTWDLTVAVYFV